MFKFLRLHRSILFLNFFVILFVSLFFNLTTPAVFKLLVEGVLPDGNLRSFLLGAAILLAVTFGRGIFGTIQDYIFLLHRQLLEVSALRSAVVRRDLKALNVNSVYATIRNYVASFQYFWIEFVFYIAYAAFISSVVLFVFYFIEREYFWVALGFMALHALNFLVFKPLVDKRAAGFNSAKSGMVSEISKHLQILAEIKSVGRERFLVDRMRRLSGEYAANYGKKEFANFMQRLVQDALIGIFYIFFFCLALYLSVKFNVSIGSGALAIFLSSLLFEPIYRFSSIVKSFYDAKQYSGWVPDKALRVPERIEDPVKVDLVGVQTRVMKARDAAPINYSFSPGGMHLIRGPSGCGKSTLLDCIAGLEALASGNIVYSGVDRGVPAVYYCEQQAAVFPGGIVDNVTFYGDVDDESFGRCLAATRMDSVSLARSADANAGSLSSGQKQRLSISRSLYCGGALLLYDEPTSAQDQLNERAIFEYLAQLAKSRIVIVVSHSPVAQMFADHVLELL